MVSTSKLKSGGLVLGVLLVIFIGFYAALMIGGLIVGTIAGTAVEQGNVTLQNATLNVSDGMRTAINGYETSYIADAASLQSNATLIIGLIAIVIIMLIFGFKFNFGGRKKVN